MSSGSYPPGLENSAELFDRFMAGLPEDGWNAGAWLDRQYPEPVEVQEALNQLTQFKDWLDAFRPLPAAVAEELGARFRVAFTYNSNAIEGNTLSRQETEIVLLHGVTVAGKSLVEHMEVIGHRDAMRYMEELVSDGSPLDQRVIRDFHSLIMLPVNTATGNSDAGSYRTIDVRASGSDHRYPPHYRVGELMEEFSNWLLSSAGGGLHPVARAAEAHYRFVAIHPFRDGNGRTGRLLMNLLLLRAGYPIAIIPVTRRVEYIHALVHAQENENHTEPLIKLIGAACRRSFSDYFEILATALESRGRGAEFYRSVLGDAQ